MSLKPILTAAQMRTCDSYTIESLRIPSQTLMERAAERAVTFLLERKDLFPTGKVLLLCGGGNNGGDGIAMGRLLSRGVLGEPREAVILYTGRLNEEGRPDPTAMSVECHRQLTLALEEGVALRVPSEISCELKDTAVVVDAICGIGLDRPLKEELASLLSLVTASGLPVLAVDIPTGIHADTGRLMGMALPARGTVTMQALKRGLLLYPGADYCGEIFVAELGISYAPLPPSVAQLADLSLLSRVLPPRIRRSHKGSYGRVTLLCGSEGMSGAAVLATQAALRCGAGLAHVLTSRENRVILQTTVPEAILSVYDTPDAAGIHARVETDALVVGCGLGLSPHSHEVMRQVLQSSACEGGFPVVVDADGLNHLAQDPSLWDTPLLSSPHEQVVLTPHPVEMSRLSGATVKEVLDDPVGVATDFAQAHGVVVVLKDAHTVIASPHGQVFLCAAGNAGMAKGGSGDALAGIIGGLLAQSRRRPDLQPTIAEVAAAGVFLHARAGDLAAEELGEYGMLPGDLIRHIPLVCKSFSDSTTRIRHERDEGKDP